MAIYHYTTIQSLALILKSRSIKFNRLDLVDDLEEAAIEFGNEKLKLGMYEFVSCWTKETKENIALWKMYTDNEGIMISMPEDMFVTYNHENFESFFEKKEMIIDDDILIKASANIPQLYDVVYDDNYMEKTRNILRIEEEKKTEVATSIKIIYDEKEIGKYKSSQWKFQTECRFKIHVLPVDSDSYFSDENLGLSAASALKNGKSIKKEYLLIKLKDEALQKMQVTMGPFTTESDKIIVDSLLEKYGLKNVLVKDSTLRNRIRNPYK